MEARFAPFTALLFLACGTTGSQPPPPLATAAAVSPAVVAPTAAACAAPPATSTKLVDLAYVTGPAAVAAHKLDLVVPDGPGPYPLLVWIHGGAWRGGDKRHCPVSYQAERGYAVASINYRLSGEARFPAQIQDVKAALRWLRANAAAHKIDPARIAVSGDSAGGHLTSLAGTAGDVPAFDDATLGNAGVSSRVAAAIPFFGPSDLLAMNRHAQAAGCAQPGHDHDAPASPESQLIGCPIQSCPDSARVANPLVYITPDDPPFQVQHGARDCTVAPDQSRVLHEALKAGGVQSALVVEPERAHGGAPFDRAHLDAFLDRHLSGCAR